MKRKNDRLNHAPDDAETALLLIDVINDLEFNEGEKLLAHALPMASALAQLKRRAKAAGIPAIYANDNFGRWRSDFPKLVQYCLEKNVRGRPIVAQLAPEEDDYFVLKPKHSAFFQTNLEILLKYLGATELILTGMRAIFASFSVPMMPTCAIFVSSSRPTVWLPKRRSAINRCWR